MNPIGKLNEYCQQNKYTEPEYTLIEKTGPSHSLTFSIKCSLNINNKIYTFIANGPSKQKAKQNSATKAINELGINDDDNTHKEYIRIAQIGETEDETLLNLWHGKHLTVPIILKYKYKDEVSTKKYYLTECV
jgi:hypothetical protein